MFCEVEFAPASSRNMKPKAKELQNLIIWGFSKGLKSTDSLVCQACVISNMEKMDIMSFLGDPAAAAEKVYIYLEKNALLQICKRGRKRTCGSSLDKNALENKGKCH